MYKMLVIGFSTSGIPLIKQILQALPKDYPLPIAIVAHLSIGHESWLAKLLGGITQLPVSMARDKAAVVAGTVYIAPSDYHLLVEKTRRAQPSFALSVDKPDNTMRPSIDVLFESAAEVFKSDLIAVLLSGANIDGAEGMAYVKKRGGITIVLDPHETEFNVMPSSAIQRGKVDYVATVDEIVDLLLSVREVL